MPLPNKYHQSKQPSCQSPHSPHNSPIPPPLYLSLLTLNKVALHLVPDKTPPDEEKCRSWDANQDRHGKCREGCGEVRQLGKYCVEEDGCEGDSLQAG